jgi:hypothetical protein
MERRMPVLPVELFKKIVDHLGDTKQLGTLAIIMRSSQATYDTIAPVLHRDVTITRKNARSLFLGLPTPPEQPKKNRVVSKGITWEELQRGSQIKESKPKTRQEKEAERAYVLWPDVELESEPESETETGLDKPTSPYPSHASARRKRSLLKAVRHLRFEEMPPSDVGLCLETRLFSAPLMPNLETVCIGPRAIWQIADWRNRHGGHLHPLRKFLHSLKAEHICLQLPVIDQCLEQSYISTRMVPFNQHASRDSCLDQMGYLGGQLKHMVQPYERNILADETIDNLPMYNFKSSTIHNQTWALPRQMWARSCRIFFRPCACRDLSFEDAPARCYQHIRNTASRIPANHLPSIVTSSDMLDAGINKLKSLELIDLDWVPQIAQSQDSGINTIISDLDAAIRSLPKDQAEALRAATTTISSAEAKPCACCGNRQLSYAQVREVNFKQHQCSRLTGRALLESRAVEPRGKEDKQDHDNDERTTITMKETIETNTQYLYT